MENLKAPSSDGFLLWFNDVLHFPADAVDGRAVGLVKRAAGVLLHVFVNAFG